MHLPLFPLSILLLSTALPAFAQTAQMAQTPPAPRYYVGLGLYSSYYQPLSGQANRSVQLPVQLTAGYQLRPRLAVQVGLAYSETSGRYAFVGRTYGSGPTGYIDFQSDHINRALSASVLARYTLTRNPARRLQFDALGGVGLERGTQFSRGTQADSLDGSYHFRSFATRQERTNLVLSGGLGTRLRLCSHLALTFDFTLNKALNNSAPSPAPAGLTGSSALGLRYQFGRR